MPIIKWDDSLSVQVKELDEQHKKFIESVNEFHDALLHVESDQLHDFKKKALESMREYAVFHFIAEEQYMKEIGYPDLDKHKKIHDQFISKLREYEVKFSSGKLIFNSEIMKTLKNWLHDHLLTEDRKYSAFALKKQRQ